MFKTNLLCLFRKPVRSVTFSKGVPVPIDGAQIEGGLCSRVYSANRFLGALQLIL